MKKSSIFINVLRFLPLLIFYVALVLIFSRNEIKGDEIRHLDYTINLSQGFYTDSENPSLRNGPGYPIAILLPVLIDAPYIIIKLFNALFLVIAVVFFFKTVSFYIKSTYSVALAYLFGFYPPFLKWMVNIYSESLAIALMCGFLYFFIKAQSKPNSNNTLNLVLSACCLGFLALTKVIFVYIILCIAIIYIILYLLKRTKKIKYAILVLTGAFILCLPYLLYTYSLTGKTLYLGSQGGELLYWRSTPFPNEYGDWFSADVVLGDGASFIIDTKEIFKNHGNFIQSLEPYSYIQKDSLYKVKAIENMKQYPLKYTENTFASTLRLFFDYPKSYRTQKLTTFFYIIPNMFLLTLLFSSCYLAMRNLAAIPFEIRFIGLMALIFIGGLTILNGRVKHLLPIIPILYFIIAYIFNRLVKISVLKNTT